MVRRCMACSVFSLPFLNLFLVVNPAHLELPLCLSSSPGESRMRNVLVVAHAMDRAAQISELPRLPLLQSGDQSVCPRDFRRIK